MDSKQADKAVDWFIEKMNKKIRKILKKDRVLKNFGIVNLKE